MPEPWTRLQAHKPDSVRIKANKHDKGRISTNKADVVESLARSSLFVIFVAAEGCAFGSQTHGGMLRKAAVFLRKCRSGT